MNDERVSDEVARVLSEHRYYHREGLGDARCDCGVIAPLTVCDYDIRSHIADALLPLIERAHESGYSNGYIAGFADGDARARKVLGGGVK